MKKWAKALGCILAVSFLLGLGSAFALTPAPELVSMETVLTTDNENSVYLVENRGAVSYIYGVEAGTGEIGFVYSEKNNGNKGEKTRITYSAAEGNVVYFIREWQNPMKQSPHKWELLKYHKEEKTVEIIELGEASALSKVTGISFHNKNLFLSGMVEVNGEFAKAAVYAIDKEDMDDGFRKHLEAAALAEDSFQNVLYADDILSCLLKSGTVLKSSFFSKVYVPEENNEIISAMGGDGSYFWYYDRANNTVRCSSAMVAGTPIPLSKAAYVKCGTPIGKGNMAMLLDYEGSIELVQLKNGELQSVDTLKLPLRLHFTMIKDRTVVNFSVAFGVLLLFYGSFLLYSRCYKIAVRLTIVFGYGAIILLLSLVGMVYENGAKEYEAYRLAELELWSDRRISELNSTHEPVEVLTNEQNYVVTGEMLTQATTEDLQQQRRQLLRKYLTLGGSIAICITAVLALFCFKITRYFPKLMAAMEDISCGRFEMDTLSAGKDEVGALWRGLTEVCMSLSIKDYEMKNTIASYHRFVPHGMEKLLDRASIMEISFGDLANIKGNIGIISVHNIDAVGQQLNDNAFMSFVNDCYGHIHRNLKKYHGMILSNQFDLTALKVALQGSGESGVDFGLHLLEDILFHKEDTELRPDVFLMLHFTEFLYGVAGTKDTAFPFLSSREMAFLSSYPPKFAGMGVKIVCTEQYLAGLSKVPSNRYIGFISSDNQEYVYKLYEFLDVYDEREALQRAGYDKRFQNAIALYYKNDFYIARNEFLELLKICPQDGIAKWYLFACEHYFNSDHGENAVYQLFGIQE